VAPDNIGTAPIACEHLLFEYSYDGKLNLNETINDPLTREISPFSSPLSIIPLPSYSG